MRRYKKHGPSAREHFLLCCCAVVVECSQKVDAGECAGKTLPFPLPGLGCFSSWVFNRDVKLGSFTAREGLLETINPRNGQKSRIGTATTFFSLLKKPYD